MGGFSSFFQGEPKLRNGDYGLFFNKADLRDMPINNDVSGIVTDIRGVDATLISRC